MRIIDSLLKNFVLFAQQMMTIAEEEWREVSHLNADNCCRGGAESYIFPSKNFCFSCILRSIFDQNLIHCVTYFATYFPKTRARGAKGRSDNFIFCCRVFSSSSGSCQGHCYPVGLCWLSSCEHLQCGYLASCSGSCPI